MGLLGKANAKSDTDTEFDTGAVSADVQAFIERFHQKNSLFHCLLLSPESGEKNGLLEIAAMSGSQGVECSFLPDGNCIFLLPGGLDIGLFSHRLSKSSGSTVILQFSADSPSFAFEKLAINNE